VNEETKWDADGPNGPDTEKKYTTMTMSCVLLKTPEKYCCSSGSSACIHAWPENLIKKNNCTIYCIVNNDVTLHTKHKGMLPLQGWLRLDPVATTARLAEVLHGLLRV
jgi:hypothetical protein